MYILGISGLYHDSAAALIRDGEIIAAAQEERFTRVKHDAHIPVNAMRYCLRQGGITSGDLEAVVYYDQPMLTLGRFLKNALALGPEAGALVEHTYPNLFSWKLWIHKQIESAIGSLGKHRKLLVAKHHISHAASAFYPSPYGKPVYYDVIKEKIIDIKRDGSYRLNMEYFDYHRGGTMINEGKISELFGGGRRQPESRITQREMDIAASVQKVTEEVVILLARHAKEEYGDSQKGSLLGPAFSMEFGPRALGNRSILADCRSPYMQSRINLKIKYRESFRPFAPLVLAEKEEEYFDLPCDSPYMLKVGDVQPGRRKPFDLEGLLEEREGDMLQVVSEPRSDIPAVTHVDYSARIQTVDLVRNPELHGILSEYEKLTGCAVLVNTSFNVRGEPIVCTPKDSYECFMRTDMDVLVLEDAVLYKGEQPEFVEKEDWREKYALD